MGPAGAARALYADRLFRFLCTGVVNTAFGYAVYYVLLRLTDRPLVALTLGTIIGVIFNFFTIGGLVFKSRDPRLLVRFFASYGVVYLYNLIALSLLGRWGVDPALGGLLILPGAVTLSWLLNSKFVFAGAAVRPRLDPIA